MKNKNQNRNSYATLKTWHLPCDFYCEHFYVDEDITLIENAINSFNTENHNETKN